MKFLLSQVTRGLQGNLIKDGEFDTLEYCTGEIQQPFLTFMENPKFIHRISKYATCVLCREELAKELPEGIKGIFVTEMPKIAFHQIHNKLSSLSNYGEEKRNNTIGIDCKISKTANISSNNVVIGDRVIIENNVTIEENVIIGDDCIIHSGAVVGGKAFTFARMKDEAIIGLVDLGYVVLGKRVEIFPLSHIARGILPTDKTIIGDDSKIDALVHIGHGAKIGKRTLIAASALISGNVKIGNDSWVGVNATISNRITIGNNARVSLGAVVTKDVADYETVTGNFAIEHERFIQQLKKSVKDDEK